MSKTPSDPSSRDLIQYHMYDLSIYDGLRCNFQISNSSTLWDTAASFMYIQLPCLYIPKYTYDFPYTSLVQQWPIVCPPPPPKKKTPSLNESQRALPHHGECIMHVKQLLRWSPYRIFFFAFFFSLFLFIFCSPKLLAATENSTSLFFSHHSFRKQSAMRWLECCRFTRLCR